MIHELALPSVRDMALLLWPLMACDLYGWPLPHPSSHPGLKVWEKNHVPTLIIEITRARLSGPSSFTDDIIKAVVWEQGHLHPTGPHGCFKALLLPFGTYKYVLCFFFSLRSRFSFSLCSINSVGRCDQEAAGLRVSLPKGRKLYPSVSWTFKVPRIGPYTISTMNVS